MLLLEGEGLLKNVEHMPGIRNMSKIMTTKDEGKKETVLKTQG